MSKVRIRPDARPYGMQGIDTIAELIDSASRPVTFPASQLPHESARKLLVVLGVTIVEDVALDGGRKKDGLSRDRLPPPSVERVRPTVEEPRPRRRATRQCPSVAHVHRKTLAALERARARGMAGDDLERVAERWA